MSGIFFPPTGPAGRYTPTVTPLENVTSVVAPEQFMFLRVLDMVFVAGRVDVAPTTVGIPTRLAVTLPIPSDFGSTNDCLGTATGLNTAGESGCILADITINQAEMRWTTNTTSNHGMRFLCMYRII